MFGKTAKQLGPEPYVSVEHGSLTEDWMQCTEAQQNRKITDFSYENDDSSFISSLILHLRSDASFVGLVESWCAA